MLVGGEFRAAADGATRAIHSARDGSVLVDLAWAQPADADAAVAAARERFDRGPWPRMHARERGEILQEFARLVEAHRDEIALLISLEMGKPIRTAYEIELRALIRCLRFYGELADKESGDIPHTDRGRAGPGHPRAGRRGRRRGAVELPADARRLEVRAGAGRRLHGGAQDR